MREIIFHLLYSSDFAPHETGENIPFLMQHHKVTKKALYTAESQAQEIRKRLSEIDRLIASTSTDYALDRIPKVEKNLLRLGVYELYFSPAIPPKVALSEAVRLARKFSSEESGKFINAILDAIYRKKTHV